MRVRGFRTLSENAHAQNFHYTPYLPTIRGNVYCFLLIFVGRKAMEIFMEKRPFDLNAEDVTKFGEFVSSFDAWLSFEEQSKRASHLENNTKANEEQTENTNDLD